MTRILEKQAGIQNVEADFGHHHVAVVLDPAQVDREAVFKALAEGGYPAELLEE